MKIDSHGCLIMENNDLPGDLGDSCAETGRLFVLTGHRPATGSLYPFLTPAGFVRHPDVPKTPDWAEPDFTSDQGNYLMMGAWLTDQDLFKVIVAKIKSNSDFFSKWFPTGHSLTLDSVAIKNQWWNWLGVLAIAQMLINLVPLRWSDAGDRTGFWKIWRFEWAADSTVSFMTVFVTCVFLKQVGVTWPFKLMNKQKYLAKAQAYYATQPNSAWFQDLYAKAIT